MEKEEILERISGGRTDLVFDLIDLPEWRKILYEGQVRLMQWFVYYNDLTAIKAVLKAGGDLSSLDLDEELGHASFFGHWEIVDFLIKNGANVNFANPETGETPLHNALTKAGRPHYIYVVRLLVENGADVNRKTIPGKDTGAFMRDVRTKGETPLHRAAAYGDEQIIRYLLDSGADRETLDEFGNSPISWASEHLRPGIILSLLAFGEHKISDSARERITSDHGMGWGYGMERNFLGDFLPESLEWQRS